MPEQCLRGLRELCDEHGVLIIFDEVQCGMGRTGKLWAHEWAGMAPDIMAIAKALGGGFPVGACLATAEAAKGMTVGAHGSTFGGNPLAMAVGNAAFEEISKPETLANVNEIAGYLKQQLHGLKERFPDVIADVRGGRGRRQLRAHAAAAELHPRGCGGGHRPLREDLRVCA